MTELGLQRTISIVQSRINNQQINQGDNHTLNIEIVNIIPAQNHTIKNCQELFMTPNDQTG